MGCLILLGSSCGKPSAGQGAPGELVGEEFPVKGYALFGSQCPQGFFSPLYKRRISLWQCPMGVESAQLVDAPRAIVLQADCREKLIAARSPDGRFDSLWKVFPDNTFNFTIDGAAVGLVNDGTGSECSTPTSLDIWGQIDCTDRDQAVIHVQAVWWLGKPMPTPTPTSLPIASPSPTPSATGSPSPVVTRPTPTPRPSFGTPVPTPSPPPRGRRVMINLDQASGRSCRIPSGCYLYSNAVLKQCE